MKPDPTLDPQLLSIEAYLAADPPQISAIRRNQLLFESGYSAGSINWQNTVLRWQRATTILGSLLMMSVAYSVIMAVASQLEFNQPPSPANTTPNISPTTPRSTGSTLTIASIRFSRMPDLDAWKATTSESDLLVQQIEQLATLDAHQRSLTMASLTQSLTNP